MCWKPFSPDVSGSPGMPELSKADCPTSAGDQDKSSPLFLPHHTHAGFGSAQKLGSTKYAAVSVSESPQNTRWYAHSQLFASAAHSSVFRNGQMLIE